MGDVERKVLDEQWLRQWRAIRIERTEDMIRYLWSCTPEVDVEAAVERYRQAKL